MEVNLVISPDGSEEHSRSPKRPNIPEELATTSEDLSNKPEATTKTSEDIANEPEGTPNTSEDIARNPEGPSTKRKNIPKTGLLNVPVPTKVANREDSPQRPMKG